MTAALTSLQAARKPTTDQSAVVPASVPTVARTAPVAVAGLVTGLRRSADRSLGRPATRGLAPLRRQAARAGTVRRMQAVADATSTQPIPLRQGLNYTVALTTPELKARREDIANAEEHARYDAGEDGLTPGPELDERVKVAGAQAKARHAKDPGPFEPHRALPVREARLAGGNLDITSHWELLLRYGDDAVPRWVKVDLTSADGYRVIWAADPRSLLDPLTVTGTVGEVLDVARTVADRHPTYFNPTIPDADLPAPRYSCQHFVAEIAAVYGQTLHPHVKP